jgi:hypothetical protein
LSGYTRVGISLLLLASACLIGGAVYAEYALRNPEGITYYPTLAVIRPAIGRPQIVAFVVFEHLLVASGVWCFCKGMLRRSAPPDA